MGLASYYFLMLSPDLSILLLLNFPLGENLSFSSIHSDGLFLAAMDFCTLFAYEVFGEIKAF
jgi:hypothetical protein